ATKPQRVGLHPTRVWHQPHDGATGRRLARSGFANDAEPLTPEGEADVSHGTQLATVARIDDAQVANGQQAFAGHPDRASDTSRSPSPSRLKPRLVMKMAMPGIVATHH